MAHQGLVLETRGVITPIVLTPTAQQLASTWTHPFYFPQGVYLHKMVHLSSTLKKHLLGRSASTYENQTLSLSLLCDSKHLLNFGGGGLSECNYNEIPRVLDTQLFFGNLLVILTIDGSKILPLTPAQYQELLQVDLKQVLNTLPQRSSHSYSESPDIAEPIVVMEEAPRRLHLKALPLDRTRRVPLYKRAASFEEDDYEDNGGSESMDLSE